jgi:hypothetical protein
VSAGLVLVLLGSLAATASVSASPAMQLDDADLIIVLSTVSARELRQLHRSLTPWGAAGAAAAS